MWGFLFRMAASALGGWVASDIWNEYQTDKQLQAATTGTVSAPRALAQATGGATSKNWIKWIFITVGATMVTWIILQILKLFKVD